MGQLVQFQCDACQYKVEVSGGPDIGEMVATQTVSCSKCKKLFDVVTSNSPWDPKAPTLPLRCPRSRGAKHPVTPWTRADPCPRCGGTMHDTGEVLVMWD